ncbi:hypothetical protein PTTG_06149 [Puccinia triticina 1-1 BBBD Race 1]|uniref:Uncharacterized protein n=1 Tax=Puccinia triticina (isolate 1-1 / race 1 (BBBD)) TaxID=630390 RepID=A0A0C4EZ92_PUCT1|nr:hypothetical protein PTTG_06149 [Puccinia triticina 1-1 BBBD Race 1]
MERISQLNKCCATNLVSQQKSSFEGVESSLPPIYEDLLLLQEEQPLPQDTVVLRSSEMAKISLQNSCSATASAPQPKSDFKRLESFSPLVNKDLLLRPEEETLPPGIYQTRASHQR